MQKRTFVLTLIAFIALSQLAGLLGALFTVDQIPSWYAGLVKPSFNPPNWLFGPVWTTLYTLIGIAGAHLWMKSTGKARKELLALYFVQLFLNAIWTPIFFGAEALFPALAVIILLDITVLALIIRSWKYHRIVSLLLIPYLAWILFATLLNGSLAVLNS